MPTWDDQYDAHAEGLFQAFQRATGLIEGDQDLPGLIAALKEAHEHAQALGRLQKIASSYGRGEALDDEDANYYKECHA